MPLNDPLPRWYHASTDVGRQRQANEDSHAEYALGDGSVLLVVADGMGGHEAGDVASRIAVEAIGQIVQNSPAEDPREKLRSGFLVANQRIVSEAERIGAEGMGTTGVAAYVRGAEVFVTHVGDSRLYLIHDGRVSWQTRDHTRVQKMVDLGILGADDAKHHPDANVVTRALGHAKLADGSALEPEVKEAPLELLVGDSLVLCSDGLYDGVTDPEIAAAMQGRTAEEASRFLVELANERGGSDNITVTVLHYGHERGPQSTAPPPSSPPPDEGDGTPGAGSSASSPTGRRSLLGVALGLGGVSLLAVLLIGKCGAARPIGADLKGATHEPDLGAPPIVDAAVAVAAPPAAQDGGAPKPRRDGGAKAAVTPRKVSDGGTPRSVKPHPTDGGAPAATNKADAGSAAPRTLTPKPAR